MRPKGSGGTGASAALALLDDVPASPASRRLASAPAAPRTRLIVLSPRAAKGLRELLERILNCQSDDRNAIISANCPIVRTLTEAIRYI